MTPPQEQAHRVREDCDCQVCRDTKNLARWLADAQTELGSLRADLQRMTEERDELRRQVRPVLDWVRRERALRDAQTSGGQHTGYQPSISPSVLNQLERLTALLRPEAQEEEQKG